MPHRVLQRQLRKLGLHSEALPDTEAAWQTFLERIDRTYEAVEQDRYLLERSLAISSREMQDLYEDLRRSSESRLAAERNKLRAVISSLGAGLCTLDLDGCIHSMNPEAERLLGCREADVLGTCFFERVGYAGRRSDDADPHAAIRAGQAFQDDDGVFLRQDGTAFPVSFTVNPIREAEDLRGAVLVFFDITESKRAGAALRESEQRFRQLFEGSPDAIFVEDFEGNVLDVNPAAERLHGLARAQLIGRNVRKLVPPPQRTQAMAAFRRMVAGELDRLEGASWTDDGREVPVELSASRITVDGQPALLLQVRDITARKRAEAALRAAKEELEQHVADRTRELSQANRQLHAELVERQQAEHQIHRQSTLLDHAQDAICVLDAQQRITYWNRSAARLYGWTPEEALGQQVHRLLFSSSDDEYFEALTRVLAGGEWTGELHEVTKDGRSLIVESRWTFVDGPDSALGAILIVNTDITEKKVLEAQFLRAQRMESLGTLAGGIAHDLNNILGPILISTQMLQMKLGDARSQKLLGTMEKGIQRGSDLVRQVLSFARGVKGERVAVPLKPLLAELAKILRDTLPRAIRIHLDVADDLWGVEGDVTQLHQVLMNLCVNARDAMPEGGNLTLTAENTVLADGYSDFHMDARPGHYVLLRVTDTGVGMPAEVQARIFEPFFTTKEHGTGLGLSTALGIITGHGGFIIVHSDSGWGTSFQIYLPAIKIPAFLPAPESAAERQHGQGELVLIVDDERAFREVTRHLLEEHDYRVLTAKDGAEALELYRRYRDDVQVVITDIMMPTMDGRALIKTLYSMDSSLRVIAVSGLSTSDNLAETAGIEVNAFLAKPYETITLLRTLRRVLATRPRVSTSY